MSSTLKPGKLYEFVGWGELGSGSHGLFIHPEPPIQLGEMFMVLEVLEDRYDRGCFGNRHNLLLILTKNGVTTKLLLGGAHICLKEVTKP